MDGPASASGPSFGVRTRLQILPPPSRRSPPQSARFIELTTNVMRCLLLACASNLPGRIKFHCRGNICNL